MNNMKKWTKTEDKKLKALWNKKESISLISQKTGRTISACRMRIKLLQDKKELSKRYGKSKLPDYYALGLKPPIMDYNARYQTTVEVSKTSTAYFITKHCDEIKTMLLKKNEAYGDSALKPVRVFSKSDADEQIKVRIDDKLNRLMQGKDILESDNDVIKDLIGYLILLLINQDKNN